MFYGNYIWYMLPVSLVQVLENSRSAYCSRNSNFFTKCLKFCPESKSDGCLIALGNTGKLKKPESIVCL